MKLKNKCDRINSYKFSKLENFNQFNFEPLILSNGFPGNLVADNLEGIITKVFIEFFNYFRL